jgi:ABC-type uncharacterized transport system substrate-binding protein
METSQDCAAAAVNSWLDMNPDFKSIVIFYIPTEAAQTAEYEITAQVCEERGIEVKGVVECTDGQTDMSAAVTRAMSYEADCYYCILRDTEFSHVQSSFITEA